MLRCFRRHSLAIVLVSFSGASALAQLPSQQRLAPINQLGRSWGFGVSDGYHECPEGKCGPSSLGFLDKLNPFGSTLYPNSCAVEKCGAPSGPVSAIPMTVLPPSPQMYQQYAKPIDNPMPGSSPIPQPQPPYQTSPVPIPHSNQMNYPPAAPPLPIPDPLPVPDPLPMYQSEPPQLQPEPRRESPFPQRSNTDDDRNRRMKNESLLDDEANLPEAETVTPPAPQLRKRHPDDKPLGEMPESWSEPKDEGPKTRIGFPEPNNDDDLNLLPNSPDLGPTTQYRRPNPFGTVSYPTEQDHHQQRVANQRAREAGYRSYGRPATAVPSYVGGRNPYLYNQGYSPTMNRYR